MANDYINEIAFVAVAGNADLDRTRARAAELFSDNFMWGLDDDIWALYNIPYQPVSVLIANGVIVDRWFGALAEPEMRERLDNLIAVSS